MSKSICVTSILTCKENFIINLFENIVCCAVKFLYYKRNTKTRPVRLWCDTHIKISQLVASLQTSRQQVVFARLVSSRQQVWNKLLTTCNNLVDIIRLVTRLFQQGCCNHDITILLQPCVVNLLTLLLYHDCIRLVRATL